MLLRELCPCLARRLAFSPALSLQRQWRSLPVPPLVISRLHSASLSTSDDADVPRHRSTDGRLPGDPYVEVYRSWHVSVVRFLRRELDLSWSDAERQAKRYRHLAAVGVPLMTENVRFLTDHGVQRQQLQYDIDILGVSHYDLVRVHGLVSRLPAAEYSLYYPLSRARRDTVTELFRRLPTRRSNLIHELAHTLHLPVLTVCRAVSLMATQITKTSNKKLLRSAKLLMELGVPPAELGRSLYVLRLSGPRLRLRSQQCRRHGLPLHPTYLSMSDAEFQRRVTQGGRLTDKTADVEAVVARRLGVSRDEVVERTCHTDVLRVLTMARLESMTALLEEAGYGAQELLLALPSVYRRPVERVRQRLEECRRLGTPLPAVTVLACGKYRFERRISGLREQVGSASGTTSSDVLVSSLETHDHWELSEAEEDGESEVEPENTCGSGEEVEWARVSKRESNGSEGTHAVEGFDGSWSAEDCEQTITVGDKSSYGNLGTLGLQVLTEEQSEIDGTLGSGVDNNAEFIEGKNVDAGIRIETEAKDEDDYRTKSKEASENILEAD